MNKRICLLFFEWY